MYFCLKTKRKNVNFLFFLQPLNQNEFDAFGLNRLKFNKEKVKTCILITLECKQMVNKKTPKK